ncbi:MAG: hypothetical protein LC808_27150, partial [Actinobacteria bacterium]|nr:hypothetical protein [Actinomycetota bacterium]
MAPTSTTVAPTSTTVAPTTATTTITVPPATGGYPTTPPAQICGNASILYGPATQPVGSVRI